MLLAVEPPVTLGTSPLPGTFEAWVADWLALPDPLQRLAAHVPGPRELPFEGEIPGAQVCARRILPPPRPARWQVATRARRSVGGKALTLPAARNALLHTFLHHEMQAAELFAHALLAYPDAPDPWRRGLLGLIADELDHARRYSVLLRDRGVVYGDLPVGDWFWERALTAQSPAAFLALIGLGLEGANLDHTARFSARFAAAGDAHAADLVAAVGHEEIAHVRFAVRWFARFAGAFDLEHWRAHLPAPFTERPFVHLPLARVERERAGFPPALLDRLEREQ